jgi:hypothetical protein
MPKLKMQHSTTSNPTGNGHYLVREIKAPQREAAVEQSGGRTEKDFLGDLAKETKRVAKP